jgi:phosphatidate cytidylyltransferase
VFAFFTPLQYILVGYNSYELFSIFIPVYAFLFIPARVALAGDFKRFLERIAKIQSGLLICVYCLSFAPALLYLEVPAEGTSANARLLFFFVAMALISEALQFAWSQLYGRHVIAPTINAARTWEGFVGGSASAALVGMVLHWATPYNFVWQTAFMSMVIAVMGFAGAMTMSAIKRDRGVRDYGTLVEGHGGVLDRIDAICFAAPVFYHVSRQIFKIG